MEMFIEHPEYIETFKDLKKEGKIRAYGYSVKSPEEGLSAINDFGFEVIEVNFNLIDQRAIEVGLFDLALSRGVGIIARTPFCFGFLTDTIKNLDFPTDDHRSTWPRGQLELWASAPKLFEYLRDGKGWSAADLALKFCLAFPIVSSVIPGIVTPEEVEWNARVSEFIDLNSEEIESAIETYKSNTFFDKNMLKNT